VSLAPSVTEILFAVGASERLVAVSRQCDFPVAAKLKPKAGDFNHPDLKALREVAPDLVLFTEYVRPEDLAALEREGIRSLVLPAARLDDVVSSVRVLGRLTGRAPAAEEVVLQLEEAAEQVASRVGGIPEERRPRVYIEVDGPHRPYAVGPGSFMDDLVRAAGGRNAFAGAKAPYVAVTTDEVVQANPDAIFIDHPFQYKAGLKKRAGWSGIAAVRDGRVYDGTDFDIILLNRPSPRIVESLREVSRILHPEAWNDP
jgi:iron complex transport system substrate-binding protein